jgi:hypothetical protein
MASLRPKSSMSPTFPKFESLPAELRLHIIQYALEDTLHDCRPRLDIAFDTLGPYLTKIGPRSLIQVKSFFGKETMRLEPNKTFEAYAGSAVYFDPGTDTLELYLKQAEQPIAHYLAQLSEPFRRQVHKLRLVYSESAYRSLERARHRRSTVRFMDDVAAYFPGRLAVQIIGILETASKNQLERRHIIHEQAHVSDIAFEWKGLLGVLGAESLHSVRRKA